MAGHEIDELLGALRVRRRAARGTVRFNGARWAESSRLAPSPRQNLFCFALYCARRS